MDTQAHWETVYAHKAVDQMSWFRPHLETSLAWIERCAGGRDAAVVDIGAGASTLVDDLIERGYEHLTALDVSAQALAVSHRRLGPLAARVRWLTADVTTAPLDAAAYDVWHDRAVFHFLALLEQRTAYAAQAIKALRPGGHLILSVFGPEGPTRCSGLDAMRYSADALAAALGSEFELLANTLETHTTPAGASQQFLTCLFRCGQ
jgi:SAM-dependent methyltransferase